MRIESVEITNFKNLRHFRLDRVPQLVVLAGPNGSGKTAVFEALRLFKVAVAGYLISGKEDPADLLRRFGPVITTGQDSSTITVSVRMTEDERQALNMAKERYGSGLLSTKVSVHRGLYGRIETVKTNPYGNFSTPLQELFRGHSVTGAPIGLLDHIPPDRSFSRAATEAVSFAHYEHRRREFHGLVAESEAKFHDLLGDLVRMYFLDMHERERRVPEPHNYMDRVRDIFRYFLPDKEFLGVEFSEGLDSPPEIRVRSGGVAHDIRQLSSGEREILMTYTHLEKLQLTGSVILFDEPELHLHPTLQRRVMEYLRSYVERGDNQVWLITHSEEIVGTTAYESLFAMTDRGDPAVEPVQDKATQVDLLRELGASVGLQLASPRILFVEGESDSALLSIFLGTHAENVSIVPTGGKRNLTSLSHVSLELLDTLIAEGRIYFVRDHDVEGESDALDRLSQRHKDRFFVWDRYHIENYLLDEECIYRVLAGVPEIVSPQSQAAIGARLLELASECIDNLLAMRLEVRLRPLLGKRLGIRASEGVRTSLLSAAAERVRETAEALNQENLERLYSEEVDDLTSRWRAEWKKLCIGRDVLRAYHTRHVHPHLGYERFRNEVARKLHELGRVPDPILNLIDSVTSDIPGSTNTGGTK